MKQGKTFLFHVSVEGEGYLLADEPGELAVGFFATRIVEATDESSASERARELVSHELERRDVRKGDGAQLRIGKISAINESASDHRLPEGFTFFEE